MANAANPMGVVDFIVFVAMLLITVCIGLYHGLYKGGQTTTSQFLLANRNVFSLPVALTILASFTSPVTLLGVPAEVYINGAEYMSVVLQDFIMLPTYLQRRFGYPMRCFGSIMFICQNVLYTAIVTFTPALAIEAITGVNMEVLILITGIVCTFYTTIGGLSAVIWTDAFMAIIILGTIVIVIVTGISATGDLGYIWEVNKMANRTDLFQ
ncbi:Sodium-coupled monocarboxylate transporter 1 [Holothuria leucospilota]|uniref:Sodium-coupled monocarboxylate transporter 1 n=1 Tax=Holothuria leucospilota TaxID=206669 RepID=A0A9Q1BSG9_HOLLE|nr:Sodium-coupled monocarboxylate transporter 1 [Holothuria leucospilota]